MAVIRKIDTIGVKTLLSKGEFGLDMYTAGGDTGRVYIGTGTENIMLARIDDLGATETVATVGQTLISVVNSASMILRIDNVAQAEGVDYTIVDGNTISMITPLVGGEIISAIDTSDTMSAVTALGVEFMSNKNIANGYAGLDATGKVNSSILPSYVDDVLELDTYADLPVIGEGNKIYIVVADETKGGDGSTYRWTGTVYAVVSNTMTAADLKALYEGNLDTNVYTDAEKLKLAGIIDDTTASTLTAYSGSKVQEMHNAQQTALNLKANLASPSLTGVPTAPTAAVDTSTTQLATTEFVVNEINKIEEW